MLNNHKVIFSLYNSKALVTKALKEKLNNIYNMATLRFKLISGLLVYYFQEGTSY